MYSNEMRTLVLGKKKKTRNTRIHQEVISDISPLCPSHWLLLCCSSWELDVKGVWLDVTLRWKALVDPSNKTGCQWDQTDPRTLPFSPPCAQEVELVYCWGSHARLWANSHPLSSALAALCCVHKLVSAISHYKHTNTHLQTIPKQCNLVIESLSRLQGL